MDVWVCFLDLYVVSNDLSNILHPVPCCFGYMSLWCVLKSRIVMSPVLFFHFLFNFLWLLWVPLCSNIYFRFPTIIRVYEEFHCCFNGEHTEFVNCLLGKDILTKLCHPTHGCVCVCVFIPFFVVSMCFIFKKIYFF